MGQLWIVIFFIMVLVLLSFLSTRTRKKKIVLFGDAAGRILVEEVLLTEGFTNFELVAAPVADPSADLLLLQSDTVLAGAPDAIVFFIDLQTTVLPVVSPDPVWLENFYRAVIVRLRSGNAPVIILVAREAVAYHGMKDQEATTLLLTVLENLAGDLGVTFLKTSSTLPGA